MCPGKMMRRPFDRNKGGSRGDRRGGDSQGSFDRSRSSESRRSSEPRKLRRLPKFVIPAGTKVDYKNVSLLQKFITDRGKIQNRRLTGVSAKDQRQLAQAIRQARFLALLPTSLKGLRRR